MNVTLPKELEDFVLSKTAAGQYPSADAVVVEALREFQGKVDDDSDPAWVRPLSDGSCPTELKPLLLEAVRRPHHPMPADYFDRLRQRLRACGAR